MEIPKYTMEDLLFMYRESKEVTDSDLFYAVADVTSTIERLKTENDKLKVCGNCDNKKDSFIFTDRCYNCSRNKNYCNPKGCTDNWGPG